MMKKKIVIGTAVIGTALAVLAVVKKKKEEKKD